MPSAKDSFISRITNFERIVSPTNPSDSVLTSKALTEVEHNEKVTMLRNGMAIIGFTILEDFIKKRVGEVLKEIGKTSVSFSSLPKKLKDAATISALKGIQIRAENLRNIKDDYLTFIQSETGFISSTKEVVFEISEYALGWDKSNISEMDISKFLSVFNIAGGWNAIQNISSAINISLTNPSEIFRNAAQRRHRAAHNAAADSLLTDLQNYVSQAKVIACGFDALISKSLKHIKNNNTDFLNEDLQTDFNQLSFRFLIEVKGKWKEFKNISGKAFRVKVSYSDLFKESLTRAIKNGEILIVKSESNQLIDWHYL